MPGGQTLCSPCWAFRACCCLWHHHALAPALPSWSHTGWVQRGGLLLPGFNGKGLNPAVAFGELLCPSGCGCWGCSQCRPAVLPPGWLERPRPKVVPRWRGGLGVPEGVMGKERHLLPTLPLHTKPRPCICVRHGCSRHPESHRRVEAPGSAGVRAACLPVSIAGTSPSASLARCDLGAIVRHDYPGPRAGLAAGAVCSGKG